jgi:hypothetical protein
MHTCHYTPHTDWSCEVGFIPRWLQLDAAINCPHLHTEHTVRTAFRRTYQFNLILTKLNLKAPQQTLSQLLPRLLPVEYLTCLPCLRESTKKKKKWREHAVYQWNPHLKKIKNWTTASQNMPCSSRLCFTSVSEAHIPGRTQDLCLSQPSQHDRQMRKAPTNLRWLYVQYKETEYTSDYMHGLTGLWFSHAPFRRMHNPVDSPLSLLCPSILLYTWNGWTN